MTCPGCTNPGVGHYADCEVTAAIREAHRSYEYPGLGRRVQTPSAQDTEKSAAARIRERIAEKRAEYESFKGYLAMRVREDDLHGIWDCGAQMSEVSCYIDGLMFALEAMGEKP